jgi:hypothetical protein
LRIIAKRYGYEEALFNHTLFTVRMSMVGAKAFAYDFESDGIYYIVNGERGLSK